MHCIGALHICSTNLSPANVPRHAIAIFTNVLQAELDHSKKSFCDHFPPNPRKKFRTQKVQVSRLWTPEATTESKSKLKLPLSCSIF